MNRLVAVAKRASGPLLAAVFYFYSKARTGRLLDWGKLRLVRVDISFCVKVDVVVEQHNAVYLEPSAVRPVRLRGGAVVIDVVPARLAPPAKPEGSIQCPRTDELDPKVLEAWRQIVEARGDHSPTVSDLAAELEA